MLVGHFAFQCRNTFKLKTQNLKPLDKKEEGMIIYRSKFIELEIKEGKKEKKEKKNKKDKKKKKDKKRDRSRSKSRSAKREKSRK